MKARSPILAPYGCGADTMKARSPITQWGSQYEDQEPRMAVGFPIGSPGAPYGSGAPHMRPRSPV